MTTDDGMAGIDTMTGNGRPDPRETRDKRRATWAGVAVNLPLALAKIAGGLIGGSQALVADGVHSLPDLASDAAVLWALSHSAKGPDREHPFGHGRFETLATLAVAAMLALAAVFILIDAGTRLISPEPPAAPGALALGLAVVSIAAKEALYRYTIRVARRTGSALIAANALHHRSDALSSVVALVGIGAAMAGLAFMDAVAAGVIALMLVRVTWTHGSAAVHELVDAAPHPELKARLRETLTGVPGVRDAHDLRLRGYGAGFHADVHLSLDPEITLSEAHRITEAARTQALAAMPVRTRW